MVTSHRLMITSLLAAPHYEAHCKKTRQEVLSSGSPSHCTRRWQQTGEGLPCASVKYDCPSWLDNDPANDTGSQADGEGTRGNGGARGATCETWLL